MIFSQVVSMAISIASILMMPLDAASRSSKHGGLPMEVLWYTVFIAQAALAVIIIPFAYFYYSAYDPDKKCAHLQTIHCVHPSEFPICLFYQERTVFACFEVQHILLARLCYTVRSFVYTDRHCGCPR